MVTHAEFGRVWSPSARGTTQTSSLPRQVWNLITTFCSWPGILRPTLWILPILIAFKTSSLCLQTNKKKSSMFWPVVLSGTPYKIRFACLCFPSRQVLKTAEHSPAPKVSLSWSNLGTFSPVYLSDHSGLNEVEDCDCMCGLWISADHCCGADVNLIGRSCSLHFSCTATGQTADCCGAIWSKVSKFDTFYPSQKKCQSLKKLQILTWKKNINVKAWRLWEHTGSMELVVIWETRMRGDRNAGQQNASDQTHATEMRLSRIHKRSTAIKYEAIFIIQNTPKCTCIVCTLKLVIWSSTNVYFKHFHEKNNDTSQIPNL